MIDLKPFASLGLSASLLDHLLTRHAETSARFARLWSYYRNPRIGSRLAQEAGLPSRITGRADAALDDRTTKRREVVIENDIGWRIQAMVDFMFGKPVRLISTARDESLRSRINRILDAVFESSGGIALLQDAALLGHIYGHIDFLLRSTGQTGGADEVDAAARALRIEVIEPSRGIPLLNSGDYRQIDAYIIRCDQEAARLEPVRGRFGWPLGASRRARTTALEVFSATHHQRYLDGTLVADTVWTLTRSLPIVHIQNISQPFRYEGMSDVEPLIPLQDELNTRLSDRACRVTMRSFKMYLAKGLDGFDELPVGPGQIWSTDNTNASVEAFGGDADSPSEESHILEVREALDKTSGIPPLASGVVRAKIGNLTSANALRITLMGVLSKTARKRITYGRGLSQLCTLILEALDSLDILKTDPQDRAVKLIWPDPLPEDLNEQAALARAKQDLGVPREELLTELGYTPTDQGVT